MTCPNFGDKMYCKQHMHFQLNYNSLTAVEDSFSCEFCARPIHYMPLSGKLICHKCKNALVGWDTTPSKWRKENRGYSHD